MKNNKRVVLEDVISAWKTRCPAFLNLAKVDDLFEALPAVVVPLSTENPAGMVSNDPSPGEMPITKTPINRTAPHIPFLNPTSVSFLPARIPAVVIVVVVAAAATTAAAVADGDDDGVTVPTADGLRERWTDRSATALSSRTPRPVLATVSRRSSSNPLTTANPPAPQQRIVRLVVCSLEMQSSGPRRRRWARGKARPGAVSVFRPAGLSTTNATKC